ncbi:MAG: penicillin-binding protein [Actinomadura sp.]
MVIVKAFRLLMAAVIAGALIAFIALPVVGSGGVAARDAANGFQKMPADLKTTPPPEKTVVYDAEGKQLATFFDRYRESVRLDQVNPIMKRAIIAIEDSRFYEHGALDLKGAIRALAANAEAGATTQGGSTLTQQLVKNLLVESAASDEEYRAVTAPTAGRKLRELRYALDIEQTMSKDQILQSYLNIAYFGAGAYGVQAAAKRYFSRPASELKLEEAALLAGITKNPAAFDPTRNPKDARTRRDVVLRRMAQLGIVTRAQADAAAAKPIKLKETRPEGGCERSSAAFFCEYVRHEMIGILANGKTDPESIDNARKMLQRGGYTIRTTLDPQAQRAADRAVRKFVDPADPQVASEAMVQPGTGYIRAMAASKKFGSSKKRGQTSINIVADGAHGGGMGFQAGSTFKAFTLATALKEGMSPNERLTARAPFVPSSGFTRCNGQTVNDPDHQVFNASREGGKGGSYSLRTGTWGSVNTFFMTLERKVGLCDTVKTAKAFGIHRANGGPLSEVSTFTLGVNEMDPVTVASAFAGFAARGRFCRPIAITEVVDPDGKKLKVQPVNCRQALDQKTADGVNSILQGVFTKGTMRGVGGIDRPAAGKTGTTDNSSAAWFAGYTPDLAAAVSVGDLRGAFQHPLSGSGACMGGRCYGTVFGATVPGPIWKQSMIDALRGTPETPFAVPPDYGDELTVPDVRGLPVSAAISELASAGFEVRIAPRPVRSDQPNGTVARTDPGAGSTVDEGDRVTIFISQSGRPRLGGGGGGGGIGPPPPGTR